MAIKLPTTTKTAITKVATLAKNTPYSPKNSKIRSPVKVSLSIQADHHN
jgi:hypothetical protein